MTDGVDPGWYQDPLNPTAERWWDGRKWVQNTRHASKPHPRPAALEDEPVVYHHPTSAANTPASQAKPEAPLTEEQWRTEMLTEARQQTRYLQSFWTVLLIFLVLNLIVAVAVFITAT